jgi:N-acetylmuramoyl-L-alanine amidase
LTNLFLGDGFVSEVTGEVIGTVILDAGHGGSDCGATSNDIYEKDINLNYVREIGNYLMKHGVQVTYTRVDDSRLSNKQSLDLWARSQKGINKDYFISVHVNSHDSDKYVSGFEIYYKNNDEKSFDLAKTISNNMEELNYSHNRGVKEGNTYYVIRNNVTTPILIELGYINEDQDYLLNNKKIKKLSMIIAEGIINTIKENNE